MSHYQYHYNPDSLIRALERGEDPLTWASSLLYRALDRATPEDTAPSLAECHAPGIDSVVLWHGGPGGGMIRFYLSHAGLSPLPKLLNDQGHFNVGVHNHRYRIAKIPLNAAIVNYVTRKSRPAVTGVNEGVLLWEYGFTSGVTGQMSVSDGQPFVMEHFQPDVLVPGDAAIMEPEDLHTIVTPKRLDTAWIVVEGVAAPGAESIIYSPRSDLDLSDDGLYRPMGHEEARASIRYALQLLEGN